MIPKAQDEAMSVEKPLSIRDYLAPRAAASGRRGPRAARGGQASFSSTLANERKGKAARPADGASPGLTIADYRAQFGIPRLAFRIRKEAGTAAPSAGGADGPAPAAPPPGAPSSRRPSPASRQPERAIQPASRDKASVETFVQKAAAKYDLAPELIRSVIRAESGFRPDAVSPAGAMGLMQLMPETAAELGVSDPFNAGQNIDGGARYLRQMLDRFGGRIELALAAYNAGPGAVEKHAGRVPYPETRDYVQRVLRYSRLNNRG
jgi:soluble lytic murein transglycosylase-like protein